MIGEGVKGSGRHRAVRIRPRRQVPVLISDTMTECGAACLAMVLGYFGRLAAVEECAKRCFVGRDGASALAVATAARGYGLQVKPYQVERLDDLARIDRPAILYWGFNHFVVLERFRGEDAVIVDPARGRVVVDRQELDENFTGVALAMAPGPGFRPGGTHPASPGWVMAKRVLRARGVGPVITKVALASLLLIGLGVIGPVVTTIVVDQVIPAGQRATLQVIAAGVGLVVLCRSLVSLVRGLLLVNLQNQVDRTLSTSFFEHLLLLPYSFFQSHSVGDLLGRMAANSQARLVLTQSTLSGVLDGILVVAYAAGLFAVSPTFGLVAAGFGVVQILLVAIPARRITLLAVAELTEAGKTTGFAAEALRGIDSVKAAGSEAWAFSRWHTLYERQLTAGTRRARLSAVVSVAMTAAADASTLILPLLAGWQVLSGAYSVGAMFGLIALAANFSQPLTRLAVTVQQLQGVQGQLRRLATVLATTTEQGPGTCRPAPTLTGHIDLHDVGLRHPGAGSWAVRHIALTIPAGAQIAFVGPSGSGKSTLVKMILGFYPPTEGRVLLDGHDLRELDLRTVRRQCGVVTQEVAVFNGTIRQNIAFGNPDLPFSEVRRAAQLADLERDIATMPMGYETIISENGSALSGGQRQRLALARALSHRPAILILDEATSALDTLAETTIGNNLAHAGITTITVAHRLSTIRRADTIVVLHNGGIAEIGNHDTLVAYGGLYAAMATGAETTV
ncbi:MAG TPA: peptidase domain-containing ABC transporter [Amycolatopsis sp.]|uniref:peptidase domain-containing ABC transporter n=1 Tax=Amycolatopsis sp. TaxID=37632 RepID=UPI002B48C845|nr:peptidase domain-containing ABC transporter [Amycolatopsis sp.]HKS48929.1 peptidase domain-containing ABC transporter [Amycolatopsis sp.]